MPDPRFPALTLDELTTRLGSRARSVACLKWLYGTRPLPHALPDAVPDVGAAAWKRFCAEHALELPRVRERSESADGSVKYALELEGALVETVLIPARNRSTICVSSQAGCSRRCVFCATKELGLRRNLRADEIVGQYLLARNEAEPRAPATNVVFMGMGEPMDNLDEVLRSVQILTATPAPALAHTSVTVSTSGILPGLVRFLAESRASLALSLNATTDSVRERLMPQTRRWPIAALLDALRDDARRCGGRRSYFIEYVLFAGVNDTDADAARLGELLSGLPARVNLIAHNPSPASELAPPDAARVEAFRARLVAIGLPAFVRRPRGRDIAGACGQLVLARGGAPGFLPVVA